MLDWIFQPVTVIREVSPLYFIRELLTFLVILGIIIFLFKNKDAIKLFFLGFLAGAVLELVALSIGLRVYMAPNISYNLFVLLMLGLEVGICLSLVWVISTVIHNRKKGWKWKTLFWLLFLLIAAIVLPLIIGS